MASGPSTSWQVDGETVETVSDFIFGGLQNHCRWWLQPWNQKMLTPWKESDDQPRQHIKKQRHYFATKVRLVTAIVFPVITYGCESWIVKKAEGQKVDAFELWCWRRPLSPLDCKEIQPVYPKWAQSWVFIGRTDVEVETPNTLATSCEELTHWKRPWCWEGLRAGGEGDNRGWDGWMTSPTRWTCVWVNSGSWWWTGRPGMLQFMGSQRVRLDWATKLSVPVGGGRPESSWYVFF